MNAGPVRDIAKDHVLGHKGEEGPGDCGGGNDLKNNGIGIEF